VTKGERQILDWLNGAAPDLDGKWFGECDCCEKRRHYWWRRHLRKMLARINSNAAM